jgi:CxxC motif-containing protein (DUF1111 family)
MRSFAALAVVLASVGVHGCNRLPVEPPTAAGTSTVLDDTKDAFSLPSPALTKEHRRRFFVGNSFFNQSWVAAPSSVPSRDGLGPLFNARSCSGCHFKDGRSRPPDAGQPMDTMLLRVSLPARGPHGEPLEDPIYGDQLQVNAVERVAPEVDIRIEYVEEPVALAGGETVALRRPRYRLSRWAYGDPARDLQTSPRVAPAMIGLGLLEAVPEEAVAKLADPADGDQDGISGRTNLVWDAASNRKALGRFGWKAEQPSVKQQAAAAFRADMGITTSLFPTENHTASEKPCAAEPSGGAPEATDAVLNDVVSYARSLGVPARRAWTDPVVMRGERLFATARCESCHRPSLEVGKVDGMAELGGETIHPYTDLLLHDMGKDLDDGRPVFEASASEWRTAPLWGIGLLKTVNGHTFLLHDGRARGVAEAILWHGGEARHARNAFAAMDASDRRALVAFVESL